jgi:hypothetical protein
MLWLVAIILILLWIIGLLTSFMLGGYIHVLIIAAAILILIRIIQWQRKAKKKLAENKKPKG